MRLLGRILVAAGLVLVLGGAGVFVLRYRVYAVTGPSMQPGMLPGDRIVAGPGRVEVGDVVILTPDAWADDQGSDTQGSLTRGRGTQGADRVKRVLATGGQTVVCCDGGALTVDGARRGARSPDTESFRVVVPDGRLFVVGDNGPLSVDSRTFIGTPHGGTVPADAVQARVQAVAYPFGRADMFPRTTTLRATLWAMSAGLLALLVGAVLRVAPSGPV